MGYGLLAVDVKNGLVSVWDFLRNWKMAIFKSKYVH